MASIQARQAAPVQPAEEAAKGGGAGAWSHGIWRVSTNGKGKSMTNKKAATYCCAHANNSGYSCGIRSSASVNLM